MMVIIMASNDPFEGVDLLSNDMRKGLMGMTVKDPLAQLILRWGILNTIWAIN